MLCGSDTPEEGETVTDELASGVVGLLAKDFAYVIVDTPAGLDERTLAVLEHATDVVLVSSLDVSSIRSLGKEIDALERLGLLPETPPLPAQPGRRPGRHRRGRRRRPHCGSPSTPRCPAPGPSRCR